MATKSKNKFGPAMFDSIKAALNKGNSESGGQFSNIMKFPAGHEYTLRLIPNVEDPEKTFYHHWIHGWNSEATGSYMSYIGLQTFGERDPINELRWKLFKEWKEENPGVENKEYNGAIQQKEQWLVNVYVVDDPANPENNGTVKILRMGPQIKEIIDDALEGIRSKELGYDIFDLTKPHDLMIVAEKSGKKYTTYKKSFFTTKSDLDLDDDEIEEIYNGIHDLEQIYPVKTRDELEDILNEHFFVGEEKEERKSLSKIKQEKEEVEDEEEDDIPMEHKSDKKKSTSKAKSSNKPKDDDDDDYDSEIDDIMSELDD